MKIVYTGFRICPVCSCYATEILYNHKFRKEKKIIRVFSKQHGFASQDSLVVESNGWGFCGVASTPPASKGGGVSQTLHISNQGQHTTRCPLKTFWSIFVYVLFL